MIMKILEGIFLCFVMTLPFFMVGAVIGRHCKNLFFSDRNIAVVLFLYLFSLCFLITLMRGGF